MTPDPQLLVCTYLRADPTVAGIVGQRVYTKTPPTLADPWIRVQLLDDTPHATSRSLHLVHCLMQLDCYAGEPREDAQAEARTLAAAARAALWVMDRAHHTDAVVSSVSGGQISHSPDISLDPSRERYILAVELHTHP